MHAPEVLAADLERGFLLLTDLGARTYLDALDAVFGAALYADAIDSLLLWQCATREDTLRSYDEALLARELALFPDWYVAQASRARALAGAGAHARRRVPARSSATTSPSLACTSIATTIRAT